MCNIASEEPPQCLQTEDVLREYEMQPDLIYLPLNPGQSPQWASEREKFCTNSVIHILLSTFSGLETLVRTQSCHEEKKAAIYNDLVLLQRRMVVNALKSFDPDADLKEFLSNKSVSGLFPFSSVDNGLTVSGSGQCGLFREYTRQFRHLKEFLSLTEFFSDMDRLPSNQKLVSYHLMLIHEYSKRFSNSKVVRQCRRSIESEFSKFKLLANQNDLGINELKWLRELGDTLKAHVLEMPLELTEAAVPMIHFIS